MKSLKDYLCEGIFDIDDDAVPYMDSVVDWFGENAKLGIYPDSEVDAWDQFIDVLNSRQDKILFRLKKGSSATLRFNKPVPDFINFDKDNWEENSIQAIVYYTIKNQKEIDKYPVITEMDTSLSKFNANIAQYFSVEGNSQSLNKCVLNVIEEGPIMINIMNFVVDNVNKISIINKKHEFVRLHIMKSCKLTGMLKDFVDDYKANPKGFATILFDKYKKLIKYLENNDMVTFRVYYDNTSISISRASNKTNEAWKIS